MKLLPVLLAVVLPATLCRADITIVQQIQQAKGADNVDLTTTTKVKGDMARIDVNPQMAMLVNLKTGDAVSLVIPQKVAMKISGEMIKQMKKTAMPEGTAKPEPPKPTGRKDTINGFACEEYTTVLDGKKITLWVTKDAPEAQKAVAQLSQMSAGNDPVAAALSPENVPGFPVRAEIELPDQGKITATVVNVKTDALPDTDFTVPSDFKEMTPGAPPAGQ
jgi:hypothetical protein